MEAAAAALAGWATCSRGSRAQHQQQAVVEGQGLETLAVPAVVVVVGTGAVLVETRVQEVSSSGGQQAAEMVGVWKQTWQGAGEKQVHVCLAQMVDRSSADAVWCPD